MTAPIGLNIWSRLVDKTFPYLDQVADAFDSLWFPDHVQYGSHDVAEGWSLLAYALARYPDKICGHAVLCNSFRNPAHLAKMAATMQHLSGGRVVVGIGAGWNEEEYRSYGWEFPSPKTRIAQLAESIQIMRALWTDTPVTFHGEHYQITEAYCEPKPQPVPPVMVGGAGEKFTLRVVAEHADWWNYIYGGREEYARKQAILQEHCRAVGRDLRHDCANGAHGRLGGRKRSRPGPPQKLTPPCARWRPTPSPARRNRSPRRCSKRLTRARTASPCMCWIAPAPMARCSSAKP